MKDHASTLIVLPAQIDVEGFRLEAQPGRNAPFGAADGDEAVSPTPLGEALGRSLRDNDPEAGMRRREELTGEISLTSRCPTAGRYTISGCERRLVLRCP